MKIFLFILITFQFIFSQYIYKEIRINDNQIDNLGQLKKILGLKFNRILFDNMNEKNLRKGIKLTKNNYETEASGGISLKNVRKVASTGVKRISVGQITHSAPSIDLRLEI